MHCRSRGCQLSGSAHRRTFPKGIPKNARTHRIRNPSVAFHFLFFSFSPRTEASPGSVWVLLQSTISGAEQSGDPYLNAQTIGIWFTGLVGPRLAVLVWTYLQRVPSRTPSVEEGSSIPAAIEQKLARLETRIAALEVVKRVEGRGDPSPTPPASQDNPEGQRKSNTVTESSDEIEMT